ncbi:vitamin K epoxide reductase family protein [Kitasatospora aureofaciens]|uniref:Membrane protein n=1 Tax=Kitasatospora aureofaciens TaxID=1894 RepID=A0A1E7MXB2_KITAU|nr:vitamin K epoxide reductase family protein [Kitasatospora aureofaciens]OEV33072.1 vitamin K epoxide reductase [Kitasatospora aureofaciens]QEV02707.1 vitamin K epoxide reductase family protein [Streptomyces viridifaciens]UKZ09296.1 vitamin K epoxide reductase family protein [Streptomyces viridifaciens]GGU55785.1 membrane protein [Kitasatospora aureofaciens]
MTAAAPRSIGASRPFAWLLLVGGVVGLFASTVLTLDKIRLLEDPSYVPGCNINPIISCGSIMRSDQASAFGFPNSLIGLVAFGVVVAIGAGLLAGASYRRWFWLGLQAGTAFGIGFVTWLMYQTLYRIGALCPYCMVVWAAMIPLFWYTTLHNLRSGVIPVGRRGRVAVREAARYHWVVPALWYAVIALLVLNRFWYFWSTLV